MLGRRLRPDAEKKGGAKRRKWQESDDGSDEEKISPEEMSAWKAKMREEEKAELEEREKQERELQEKERKLQEAREAEEKRKEEADALALRAVEEAAEVQAALASERRRQEDDIAPPGAHPPDYPGTLPPGLRSDKMHLYKTTYCKRYEQGTCQFGADCHFAHGERELRGRPPKGSPAGTMSVQLPQELPKPALVGRPPTLAPPPPTPPPAAQQGPGRPMGIAGFGML